MSVTTKTQIPERAHHVFIDAGSDTLAGLVRTVEQIAQDLERDTTASSVWGGYSDGGWWVYEASKITHDEYMATINDSLAQPDNYERRSNAQVVTDAERTALIAALRAAQARVAELEAQVAATQQLTDAAIDFGVNEGSPDSTDWLLDEAVKYHEAQREKWDKDQATP